MKQVPKYAIIGNGRFARHIAHYLTLLKINFLQWARKTHSLDDLKTTISQSSHILLLISDKAITSFIEENPFLKYKTLIHFSGSLVTPLAFGTHPLMTFPSDLYDLKTYTTIPFIYDDNAPPFYQLFPQLPNPHYPLPPSLKSFYHTLCVMSNNFTTLLWQKFYQELTQTLNLPTHVIHPILQKTLQNLITNPHSALTGPLARNDQSTITANLQSLENDPFQNIYKAFLETYNLSSSKNTINSEFINH
ncbi:MAG: hypothetical protein C5B43_03610 [Verrucomicrobia bacterium]|nr:MAG: hypothetical protein C5B43_03610 [Verrucomicrobiota bacterium]